MFFINVTIKRKQGRCMTIKIISTTSSWSNGVQNKI